jgi:hypothetical protein
MGIFRQENMTRRNFVKGMTGMAVGCACLQLDCLAAFASNSNSSTQAKENLVAVCGLYCGACPMYLATQSNDKEKQEALLKQFSSGPTQLKMEDILCDGCIGNGRVASFCSRCEMRACPNDKKDVTRCSDCQEFPCTLITNFNNDGMPHHGEVLNNLQQIKKMGIEKWAQYDEERWQCPECTSRISWYDSKCSKCSAPRSERLFVLRPFPE